MIWLGWGKLILWLAGLGYTEHILALFSINRRGLIDSLVLEQEKPLRSALDKHVQCTPGQQSKLLAEAAHHVRFFSCYLVLTNLTLEIIRILRFGVLLYLLSNLGGITQALGFQLARLHLVRHLPDEAYSLCSFLFFLLFASFPLRAAGFALTGKAIPGLDKFLKNLLGQEVMMVLMTPRYFLCSILIRLPWICCFATILGWISLFFCSSIFSPLMDGAPLFLGLSLLMVFISTFFAFEILLKMAGYAIEMHQRNKFTDSRIVIVLLALIGALAECRPMSLSLTIRHSLLGGLEGLASLFETSLPAELLGSGFRSDSLHQYFSRVANGIREFKIEIAMPGSSLWNERLRIKLSDILVSFLFLDWDSLPQSDVVDRKRQSIKERIRGYLFLLAGGCLPALVLWLYQMTPLALTGNVFELSRIAVIIWFLIPIISRLDPAFSEKVNTLKEIKGLLK